MLDLTCCSPSFLVPILNQSTLFTPHQEPSPNPRIRIRICLHPLVTCCHSQSRLVPYDEQRILRPRQRNIKSSFICQESNPSTFIRTNSRKDDNLLLATLESVDCVDFDPSKLTRSGTTEGSGESFRCPARFESVEEELCLSEVR